MPGNTAVVNKNYFNSYCVLILGGLWLLGPISGLGMNLPNNGSYFPLYNISQTNMPH